MPFSVEDLTVADFVASGWREAVDSASERNCLSYRSVFYSKADEAAAAENDKQKSLFSLLGDLASMEIDADDAADPLKPAWYMNGTIPSDFDLAIPFLTEILTHIDDPELKARVADVLWLRRRDFKAAREAVSSYLDSTKLDDTEAWPDATARVERAFAIAAQINQRDLFEEVISRLEKALDTFNGTESSFLPVRLMQILCSRKAGDPVKYAVLAEAFARAAEGRNDWHMSREYWNQQAIWFKLAKDDEKEKAARLFSAETYVSEAESRLASDASEAHMVAAHFIERAIHALRAIGGQDERIAVLHRRLIEYQQLSVSEMTSVSHEYDASEMIAHSTCAVADKTLDDALFAFALLARSPQVETLKKQAQWERQNSILGFIPMHYKNTMGRTVARRDPHDLDETEAEADLRIGMYKTGSMSHLIQVHGYIVPARAQILREHTVRVEDMLALVRDNPFVPHGREDFFARGLHAGFNGDFATAVHFLIPQIENSIRHLLETVGVITSGLDDDGIQDERDLNRTLRLPEFADPLKEFLGEDLVFDLRGLLIERYGSNLRNQMAHGLIDYESFNSVPCIYLWWLTLRLCCLPFIMAMQAARQDEATETADDTDQSVVSGTDAAAEKEEA